MNGEQPYIGVVDPVTPAIERVKTILFRPFNLGKWFVIGFCAWLAQLGQQGGGGGGGPGGGGGGGRGPSGSDLNFEDMVEEAKEGLAVAREFVEANLAWIIPLAILVLAIGVGFWLLFTWLSSRGRFMFLHCVAENKAEVVVPWHKFSRHGNSLFGFRIVLGLIGFVIVVLGLVAGGSSLIAAANNEDVLRAVLTLVVMFLGIFVVSIPVLIIKKFTTDFVVPIMFLQTASCTAAWRQFLTVLSVNKARFFVYILFQIVIGIVIGFIVLATVCVTCCCAGCIFAIPYIGTVAMLPVLVFKRSYSLYYLLQYSPAFNVFRTEEHAEAPA
jgi:hypothetical protein